jgi:hypothetical protein
MSKYVADIVKIIESMALDGHKSEYNRENTPKKVRLIKIQPIHS